MADRLTAVTCRKKIGGKRQATTTFVDANSWRKAVKSLAPTLAAFALHWKQEATCRKLFHFNYAKGRTHPHTHNIEPIVVADTHTAHAQPNWVLYNAAGRAEMRRHFVCTNEITSQPAGAFLRHHLAYPTLSLQTSTDLAHSSRSHLRNLSRHYQFDLIADVVTLSWLFG